MAEEADFSPCEPPDSPRPCYVTTISGTRSPSASPPRCRLPVADADRKVDLQASEDVQMDQVEPVTVKVEGNGEVILREAPVQQAAVASSPGIIDATGSSANEKDVGSSGRIKSEVIKKKKKKKQMKQKKKAAPVVVPPPAVDMNRKWVWTSEHGWLRVNVAAEGPIPITHRNIKQAARAAEYWKQIPKKMDYKYNYWYGHGWRNWMKYSRC